MLVPTTLAVLGILSSCPRAMTMQCWKSQIPPPLSTRLRVVIGSHNACRFGYPFFLSPSDDDAMLEIPNPTPLSTRFFVGWFFFCAEQKRKETRASKAPQKTKTKRQVKKRTLHMYLKSPNFQEYQNDYPKLPNHSKINENL